MKALIFILVTGYQNWGVLEYSTVAGGPVLLWGGRRLLTLWYDYRLKGTSDYLEALNKERDGTIEKLKKATKYDSTQELIDKYGSKPNTPKQGGEGEKKGKRQSMGGLPNQGPRQPGPGQQPQRMFTQPPPTANIPRGPAPPPGQQQIPPPSAGSPRQSRTPSRSTPSPLRIRRRDSSTQLCLAVEFHRGLCKYLLHLFA